MYKVETFESKLSYSKEECLKQLADYLNEMGGDTIAICDMEKEWITDKNRADYSPLLRLKVSLIIYEFPDAADTVLEVTAGKWTLDELETMYMTEYDEEDVAKSTGDAVQDFLQWCRERLSH